MTAHNLPLGERFYAKVDKGGQCWLWTGAINGHGYGHIKIAGRMQYAHRVAYELEVGPIPDGLVLDHLCRNRSCVNPDHLEPVPHRANVLRGEGATASHARQESCKRGHPFDAANTYAWNGRRICRACRSAMLARRKAS